MTKHAAIDLPEEIRVRLSDAAAQTGRSEAEFVLEVLQQAIEDIEDLRDAEEITRRRLKGGSKTYTLEEVSRRLGLED